MSRCMKSLTRNHVLKAEMTGTEIDELVEQQTRNNVFSAAIE